MTDDPINSFFLHLAVATVCIFILRAIMLVVRQLSDLVAQFKRFNDREEEKLNTKGTMK